MISETNLYEPHHKVRLAIKPGITGMWQVSGRSDITDFEEVVRLDKSNFIKRKILLQDTAKYLGSVYKKYHTLIYERNGTLVAIMFQLLWDIATCEVFK